MAVNAKIAYPRQMGERRRRRIRQPAARLIALRSHHSTHRHLLKELSRVRPRANVDALIVPAGRPIAWLREATGLAAQLECALVAVCSRDVAASDAACLGGELGATTVAVEMQDYERILPGFEAVELIADTGLRREADSSRKRNLGLLLARITGWNRVLFLDDDIFAIEPQDAETAAGLLDRYTAVGLKNIGFPDNSVVCHAYRNVGGPQEQFIGAGAMAAAPTRSRSFFPDVYCADWLFFLGDAQPPRVAVTGSMKQRKFDPFANPERARSEEFGDTIAEGLYWLLDEGRPIDHADQSYWDGFLNRRARFIGRLINRARRSPIEVELRDRIVSSLETAKQTHQAITAELCTEFIVRWQDDLDTWRRFIDDLPTGLGVDQALVELGLDSVAHRSYA